MRLTHLFLTCCVLLLQLSPLVVAQEDVSSAVSAAVSEIPSRMFGGNLFHRKNNVNLNKEIELEARDIIVNIGKVNIEIEKNQPLQRQHQDNYQHSIGHSTKPIAIGKPATKPILIEKPTYTSKPKKSGTVLVDTTAPVQLPSAQDEVPSAEDDTDLGLEFPEFEDFTPSAEPTADETVLGENSTAITVQGGEEFARDGVLILTGPQIFSVTFKIVNEKVITIAGVPTADFNVSGVETSAIRKPREAVTFIIRGRGFTPGGTLFNELSDFVEGGGRQRGLFSILEPQVFLGAIPLKVVRFTDTVILARFLDVEEQRSFRPGTFLARVKVLHVELRREEKKKKGPGEEIGILGVEEGPFSGNIGGITLAPNGLPAVIAALSQRSTFVPTDGLITSPVLGVIGAERFNEKEKKNEGVDGLGSNSLLGLFTGLRFDTAVLTVQFNERDAQKIRGSFNTLFTDDLGSEFPLDI